MNTQLTNRGLIENGFVPLSRTAISSRGQFAKCWQWNSDDDSWDDVTGTVDCGAPVSLTVDDEYTEWDLKDINGDGYPDVVFNSSKVVSSVVRTVDTRPKKPAQNPDLLT